MCQFIQVQEFCPCPADDKCRRIDESVSTPYGPRHCVNQTALVTIVCKPRRFIMSHAAFAARECPNTSEGSKKGPGGDSCLNFLYDVWAARDTNCCAARVGVWRVVLL
ncbi:hypothetical protein LMH87_010294 [Akanthomyces muscarius]|uniref:Uncharacterized protein n=1 Tax=Akanthomyces muscarius TaxID=2231603 RepID=A0A9W8ULU1_AKAMU|nr:hypothetical protein LMH87_010294 [Akanthomyces muscarius]KAJ4153823.1 hypothetical protein LMH87_010294 [Akanthomyces muscarius]